MSKMCRMWLELESMGIDPETATEEEIEEALKRVVKELPAKPMEHLKDED